MLIHQIIREDAQRDSDAYQRADEIRGAVLNYLMRADPAEHYGFAGLRFSDGEVMLCLRGHQVGLTGEDAKLWFRFGRQKKWTASGHFSTFQRSGEPVITVYCLEDMQDSKAAAEKIIFVEPVHEILLHEITHYLDRARNPTMLDPAKGGTGRILQTQGEAGYYNDPVEFNAYFTNFATPLLNFLSQAGESNALRLAKVMGVSGDFQANLAMLVSKAKQKPNGAIKGFYENLSPRNRRALLKRLYGLHQRVVARLGGEDG